MFARPRPKKSILPPQNKKRKATHSIEEIKFDPSARDEYLTGFHKRKLQRSKNAQEEAAKRARQEKVELRKQIREERKREVEEHVNSVNSILREARRAGHLESDEDDQGASGDDQDNEEWGGFEDKPKMDIVDHEDEYIDDDRFTTVTVESVNVSRDGLTRTDADDEQDDDEGQNGQENAGQQDASKASAARPPKKKKPKFRYESRMDRQLSQRKAKAKKRRPVDR